MEQNIERSENTADATTRAEVDISELNPDQVSAVTLLREICAAAGLDAEVVVRSVQKPYLSAELVGSDLRDTLGRSGHSLDALQLLCNTILSHRIESDIRLLLDADGYRERRSESLRQRAMELAAEVKERNQEAELEPLPAHERRIIHSALADDPDIMTYSEGEDSHRRVIISPRR